MPEHNVLVRSGEARDGLAGERCPNLGVRESGRLQFLEQLSMTRALEGRANLMWDVGCGRRSPRRRSARL